VTEAVELALSHIDRPADIDVQRAVDGSLKLETNRSRLLQALINIIVNAAEACADQMRPGVLTISAGLQTDTHIKITIADNGCGMSEEVLRDCVLLYSSGKPMAWALASPSRRKIIEVDHRGTLSIESRKDVGTTTTVVLPMEQVNSEE
jgi:signal transduction histidine kinase